MRGDAFPLTGEIEADENAEIFDDIIAGCLSVRTGERFCITPASRCN